MEVLTLKYRPIVFENIVGQNVPRIFLSNLIKCGQIGKNIILYGSFGSGKTSIGRIYARALNCDNPTSVGSPCNVCDKCKLFLEDRFPDYIEVDGATQGGKEKIKDLVEIAKSKPYLGKYRVVCVDECHNLSRQAWDTLLKLTEEPPPYLIFIFTTTEYNKVPGTIQSRCQDFEVNVLDQNISKEYLMRICELEGIKCDERALNIISHCSKGHLRDLIKNLEKLYYFGDITVENAITVFNFGYAKNLIDTMNLLFTEGSLNKLLEHLECWRDDPNKIFTLLRSIILQMYCTYVNNIDIDIESVSVVSGKDIEIVFNQMFNISSKLNLDMNTIFDKLFSIFDRDRMYSTVELYSFIIKTYNFIHLYNFNLKINKNVTPSSGVVKIRQLNGRQFVDGYSKQVVEHNIQESETLYPHSLLNCGFSSKKKSDINIVTM